MGARRAPASAGAALTGAIFAFDGQCRLLLERGSDRPEARTAGWLLCNPSTADADHDDPTVRRMRHFTARAGCERMLVGNVWGWRATQPSALWATLAAGHYTERMAGANLDALAMIGAQCDVLFMAFGAEPGRKHPYAVRAAIDAIWQPDRPVPLCLGRTADGLPLHPLARGKHAVRNDARLEPWNPDLEYLLPCP